MNRNLQGRWMKLVRVIFMDDHIPKDHLEVCLPYSRLLAGIPILAVFQNLRWNSNKTSLGIFLELLFVTRMTTLVIIAKNKLDQCSNNTDEGPTNGCNLPL